MDKVVLYVIAILLIYIFLKIIKTSVKFFGKIAINGIIGVVSLLLFNLIGEYFGLNLELTPINALITGAFGIPGLIVLLFINA
ncbi:pro-sigmaK processing inhibitor BofA family protein [Miniphocaeibacter massiliensis]|uniref:pro-sigmaK processing inhibitor BofA family protein n=1 Tax=Miniphocaeibacter massiliensis TaxID=2041841 RepID=UPI000C1C2029|nr:pro-sigmaK processing inhibitor BofA family protein [Miniphocaeibacter massiliensis]